jgi:hypothetical protein
MTEYYKPSGKFSPTFLLYFLLVSVIVFPILGLIYAYCIWYIPFVYINFLITLGFGFLTGLAISIFVIKKGKVRNALLALIIGVLSGILALYFHWSVWIDLVINAGESYGSSRIGITVSNIEFLQVFSLIFQPNLVFEYINEVSKYGTWGIRSATVSGTFLWVIWAIEFVMVVGLTAFLAYLQSKKPFSESTNSWYEEFELPAFNFIEDKKQLILDLKNSNKSALEVLSKEVDAESESHSLFTLYRSQSGKNYLSVENKTSKLDSKGKIDFDGEEFIEYISIDSQLSKLLLDK